MLEQNGSLVAPELRDSFDLWQNLQVHSFLLILSCSTIPDSLSPMWKSSPSSRVLAEGAFPLFWLLNLRVALLSGAYHTGTSLPGFLLCIQFLFLFTSHLADRGVKSSFLKSCFLWTSYSWVLFLSHDPTLCAFNLNVKTIS